VPRTEVIRDSVGQHLWLSAEFPRHRIKLLRHQLAAACKQQKAAGVNHVGLGAEQGAVLDAID
jgi:hypothetical protein